MTVFFVRFFDTLFQKAADAGVKKTLWLAVLRAIRSIKIVARSAARGRWVNDDGRHIHKPALGSPRSCNVHIYIQYTRALGK